MRVLSVLIRPDGGGAERVATGLVPYLREVGVDAEIACIQRPRPGERYGSEIILSGPQRPKLVRFLVSCFRLRRILKDPRIQVLHLHCEPAEIVGSIVALSLPRRQFVLVVSEHTDNPWLHLPRLGRGVRRLLRHLGASIVFLSDERRSIGASVIANPLFPPDGGWTAQRGAAATRSLGTKPRIIVIGRLIAAKRVDWILHAAHRAGWPGEVLVIGDGPLRAELELLARKLDLRARFTGFLKEPWSMVKSTDVFVTASEYEGEPLTLLEATQFSIPVLVSEIPAHLRLLVGHPGLFKDVDELTSCLETLTIERSHQEFVVSEALARELFDKRAPERIASQWSQYYSALVANANDGSAESR